MSRPPLAGSSMGPTIIPPQHAESKRDRKRRETVNKIEILHDESVRNRDEKFSSLYKEYHNETKALNLQPPTSAQYLLRLYPSTIERDALLEAAEIEYQYKSNQAKKMYESERETIEGQYWDARDQVRQRLLSAIEERRRKLRDEKDGGDVVTETLLEAQIKARPTRRLPFRRPGSSASRNSTPNPSTIPLIPSGVPPAAPAPDDSMKPSDLLLHTLLAPALATISTDDILASQSSSLVVHPPTSATTAQPGKRGPRNKNDDAKDIAPAPGTVTALAIASGQQAPGDKVPAKGSRNAGASQGQWVLGKSLAELKKMEMATQIEIDGDWARMQGGGGRGRRTRGE